MMKNDLETIKYIQIVDALAFRLDCKPEEVYDKVRELIKRVQDLEDEQKRPQRWTEINGN